MDRDDDLSTEAAATTHSATTSPMETTPQELKADLHKIHTLQTVTNEATKQPIPTNSRKLQLVSIRRVSTSIFCVEIIGHVS